VEGLDSNDGYTVKPVVRALVVFSYVVKSGRDVSLTEVANALSIPKTTVFRYLHTLSSIGYLRHDVANDRYAAGPAFRSMARRDWALDRLRAVSASAMNELSRSFGETVNLAIESDGYVVYIDMVQPTRAMRVEAHIGTRDPLHSTAVGKAILAHLDESQRESIIGSSLHERTYRTVLEAKTLRRQLSIIRAAGYAVEIGENEDVAMCIGVPILDASGYPIAALSLSAPVKRHSVEFVTSVESALKEAGRKIAEALGAAGSLSMADIQAVTPQAALDKGSEFAAGILLSPQSYRP
jgi:IclR family KDG regulon transcriptional repressor